MMLLEKKTFQNKKKSQFFENAFVSQCLVLLPFAMALSMTLDNSLTVKA